MKIFKIMLGNTQEDWRCHWLYPYNPVLKTLSFCLTTKKCLLWKEIRDCGQFGWGKMESVSYFTAPSKPVSQSEQFLSSSLSNRQFYAVFLNNISKQHFWINDTLLSSSACLIFINHTSVLMKEFVYSLWTERENKSKRGKVK